MPPYTYFQFEQEQKYYQVLIHGEVHQFGGTSYL